MIIGNYKIGSYFGKLGAVEIGFVGLEIDGGDEVIGVPGAPTTFEVGFVGIFEEVLVTAQCCVLTRFFSNKEYSDWFKIKYLDTFVENVMWTK